MKKKILMGILAAMTAVSLGVCGGASKEEKGEGGQAGSFCIGRYG
ncbi:hypothetical protein EI53_02169 [Fusobacterium naviforme]|uniref:Lipoprotein n=1 Tax=Moryella indoligenes TaxID=371674 RepID=A0AAE3V8D7_9FIRM|nr:hypothetical protein [Moryella indoligenes]MDQ0151667.1 hypothetical protein [Moryella indoligenes]PSL08786.1 hypothetical protein EI53_02169 [Fusobacterium naviforme]STO28277.1 Uncharacterised protein [Fusobacterium naviforme]